MTGPGRMRRGRAGVRALAAALGLAVLAGVGVVSSAQPTDARFTDVEHAASGTFSALSLSAPSITSCTVQNNTLGVFQSVTLVWTSPHVPTWQRLTVAQGATSGTVPSSNITSTGPSGGVYTYTAVLSQTVLTSIVSNLLGGTTTLTVTAIHPNSTTWSSTAGVRRLTVALLGTGGTCTA